VTPKERDRRRPHFLRDPELLVFDDLSSALDVETEGELWSRFFYREGFTCLAVSRAGIFTSVTPELTLEFISNDGSPNHGLNQRIGAMVAERLEGPYVIRSSPVTANDRAIEDGYAFVWRDEVCLLTTDNHGDSRRGRRPPLDLPRRLE
jgi:hypothetical protein